VGEPQFGCETGSIRSKQYLKPKNRKPNTGWEKRKRTETAIYAKIESWTEYFEVQKPKNRVQKNYKNRKPENPSVPFEKSNLSKR